MRSSLLMVVGALSLLSASAEAQAPDDATRATVRSLGYEGIAHYEAGEWEAALDKLNRSYGLIKVPTLGLWSARAMYELGRWVEASERYFDVMRLPLPELEGDVHEEAQAEAKAERDALLPRIPSLTIVVPDTSHGVAVTLDDRPVALELLGAPIPVDPGEHRLVAMRDEQRVEQTRTLGEGEGVEVLLSLPPWEPPPSTVVPLPPPREPVPAPLPPPAPRPAPDEGVPAQAIAGWATLGLGGAVFAAGVVVASVALAKRNALDCVDGRCPAELADDVAAVNDLRIPSTVLITAGLLGVAAGTIVLVTTPSHEQLAVSLSPSGGALRLRF